MNQVKATIKSAAELHNYLIVNKNFDFNPDTGRDLALYKELKRSLDLPDGAFLTVLHDRNVSAESYLRALMAAAEPLAKMYQEILEFCSRANFLQSKNGAQIEWGIASNCEQICFSFETFRLFDEIKTSVNPSVELMLATKNDIMDWLAHDVFGPLHQGLSRKDFDWSDVKMFGILTKARDQYKSQDFYQPVFCGLNNHYLGGVGTPPPENLKSKVTNHKDYQTKLSAVAKAFDPIAIELVASKFIELPFWKFRWQIYEIWVIAVSLTECEQFGFHLVANRDGRSLIELGSPAKLASHAGSQSTFIYQPTYRNRNADDIRPDIVVSSTTTVGPDSVRLIIECKQRKSLEVLHLDEVQEKYEAGVDTSIGQVVIVNYDDAPPWSNSAQSKTTLIGSVRPDSTGVQEFRTFLRTSKVAKSLRKEVWFVDISCSMHDFLDNDFRQCLTQRQNLFLDSDSFKIYGFAKEVEPRQPSDLQGVVGMSTSESDPNWEGLGIRKLCNCVSNYLTDESLRIFIVSDISSEIKDKLSSKTDKLHQVNFVDPKHEHLLEMIAGEWTTSRP